MSETKQRGAAPAAPPAPLPPEAPVDDNPTAALLRAMLPKRSVEDVFAGRVVLSLGGERVELAVLSIDDNEAWTRLFNERMNDTLASLEANASPIAVLAFLQGMPDLQIALIRAYDKHGILPEDAWLRSNATAPQLITALLGVLAAAFPLAATLIELARDSGDVQQLLREALVRSTSGRPAPTAGRAGPSAVS